MAELLTTSEINARIEHIINDAKERVVLVSPYLKLGPRLQTLIEDKDRMKVEMVVIYGKNELSPTEIEWLSKLSRVRTSFCQNLHAKCYYNEFQGIVTSMNLYDYSQINNEELGVAFNKDDDRQLYEKMKEAVDRIYRSSQDIALSVQKVAKEVKKAEPSRPQAKPTPTIIDKVASVVKAIKDEGYCIRCKATLPHDPEHPYCRDCYGDWKKEGKDPLTPEKYCHWCGKPNKSTLEKPVDYECYKKHLKPMGY